MSLSTFRCILLAGAVVAVIPAQSFAQSANIDTEKGAVSVETIASGLSHPWALAFLPDGSALVTERSGDLRHMSADGSLSEPLSGVPDVDARGQGGLLDVAVAPDFAQSRAIYLSFSEKGEGDENSTAVARGTLAADNSGLENVAVIFSQQPKEPSTKHFGSRLVFDGEGHLYVAMGERSDAEFRGQSQDLASHLGKVVRLNTDGSVPDDNPFVGQEGARPEIWTYGHRNIQAAAMNPASGVLWTIEHGPKGGDEINIDKPGLNFGWPVVSFGVNYDGTPVGTGEAQGEGFTDPVRQWTPVIGPSGMIFYGGERFPEWGGNLLVGGLVSQGVVRLELDGDSVAHEERISLGKRIRDVVEGPDGDIYLLTDEDDGEVLRLSPAAD